jgi:hypothetical protein
MRQQIGGAGARVGGRQVVNGQLQPFAGAGARVGHSGGRTPVPRSVIRRVSSLLKSLIRVPSAAR